MIEDYIIDQFRKPENMPLVASTISGDEFKLKAICDQLPSEFKNGTLVDLGCGRGRFCFEMLNLGFYKVIGIEPVREFLPDETHSIEGLQFIVATAHATTLQSNSVDIVILSEVIQHLPNLQTALDEIFRILKTNGRIIILDRNINALHTKYLIPIRFWKRYSELRGRWMYSKDSKFKERWFSKNSLKLHLKKSAFKFVSHEYVLHDGRSRLLFSCLPKYMSPYSIWVGQK